MTGPTLLVDIRSAQAEATWERGLRRWVRGLATELAGRPGRCAGILVDPHLPPPRGLSTTLAISPLLAWNTATDVRAIVEAADGPVVYLQTSPFEFQPPVGAGRRNWFVPEHIAAFGLPVVGVMYDLIPLRDQGYFRSAAARGRFADHADIVGDVDHLVTISERTRREAIDHLALAPDRVTTIGTGVDPHFFGSRPDSTIAARQWQGDGSDGSVDERGVVLCVGGDDRRKNVPGLIAAWGRLDAEVRRTRRLLVICRAGADTLASWRACRDRAGLDEPDVQIATTVDDDGLMAAYLAAELVVMPSHDEGFGLPVAEAVALGRPVVTSSTGALPEVLDMPSTTFDPSDPDDMARVITSALTDDAFRGRIAERVDERRTGITWAAVADRLVAAVDGVAGGRPSTGARPGNRARPLRLALVGPLPPTQSGIADHTALVIDSLSARAEVHAFVPHDAVATRRLRTGHPVFRAGDLLGRIDPHSYDAVICCLGNSGGHEETVEVARRLPTVLWLHEVRLPALYLDRWFARGDVADLAVPVLRDLYPHRAPETTARDLLWSVQGYADAGLGMTHLLVRDARAVIVSSDLAAHLLAADQPPHHPMPPLFRIPLARPTPLDPPDRGHEPPAGPVEIVAIGVVSHQKAPERLIDAVASLRQAHGLDVHLTFVGDGPWLYFEELRMRAVTAGVADRVEMTGHLPREEFVRRVRAATLAVQLRRSSQGESSAAALEAQSLGVPVLTNIPSAAEMPPGSVELLPPGSDSSVIATAIGALLADPGRRRRLAAAGLASAAGRTADDVADDLLAAVAEVQAATTTRRDHMRPAMRP